ncbi:MAG: Ppx/GppA family phosphatase [Bacteroidetes bacterium]|nr:Ppx/GppA family phosphatase [Bacteroidota bacterium]MCW5894297.1 Ppx/GppA family phosphatase [Bacteroidota bacterium]
MDRLDADIRNPQSVISHHMRIATIDIGTNTVLLLVAEVDSEGSIHRLAYEQRIPRLGKGVDGSKNLQPESMQRVIGVLQEYKSIISSFDIEKIVACGTSAVRDAANREEFAELVHSNTGLDLEVLSGDDEAYWTYRGAVSGIPGITKATVVDIGGGSTEITVGNDKDIIDSISLDVGSVRLTERFLKHDPPTHPELEASITLVEDEIAKAGRFDFKDSTLVGVAGTATSLAILAQGLKEFSIDAVTNYNLDLDTVYLLFRALRAMPMDEIRTQSTFLEGRHDVIVAGVLILREIMAHFKFKEMIVSERGVRYGLVLREFERNSKS